MIGILGDHVFEIFNTPRELKEINRYSYATIETPQQKIAFTGQDLKEVELTITLFSPYVDIEQEISSLKAQAEKEEPLKLILGNVVYGDFVIESIEVLKTNINRADLTLKLKEYR